MNIFNIIIMFFIYSFLGWVCETIYCSVGQKKFINRGFLNGPFCPVYGFGALIVIGCLSVLQNNIFIIFSGGMILTSILEYITSVLLEKLFNTRWWDYSQYKLNINGRVCLVNSLMFGALSVLLMSIIHPAIDNLTEKLSYELSIIISMSIVIYFIIDTIITTMSIVKLNVHLEKLYAIAEEIKEKKNLYVEICENKLADIDKNIKHTQLEKLKKLSDKFDELISKHIPSSTRILNAFPNMKPLKNKDAFDNLKTEITLRIKNLKKK